MIKNSLKVAKWEIKRNLKNKTFLISMFITPLLMLGFGLIPSLITRMEFNSEININVYDETGLYEKISSNVPEDSSWKILPYDGSVEDIEEDARENPKEYFMVLTNEGINEGIIPVFSVRDGIPNFGELESIINTSVRNFRLENQGLNNSEIDFINQSFMVSSINLDSTGEDVFVKAIPAVLAGFILVAVSITGIMTFQSAIGEKKDRMAEVLLSSVTCDNLMQGKIIGYFVLGVLQALVFILFAVPTAQYYFDISVLSYLMNPILLLMIVYALLGYLMFSALFVSFGATVEDIQEAGNFHSILFVLPWTPFFVLGPVVAAPDGTIATIASYFPFTAPGVMLLRLTLLSKVPVVDVAISLGILIITSFLIMKLAGKVFKTGMLMTGKNASIKEIWKWVRK